MTSGLASCRAAVVDMAGAGIAVAVADPAAPALPPIGAEGEHVAAAVPARKAEFAAGRCAARQALTQLGLTGQAIPAGPDRAPVWPEGVVGSITHTKTLCIAVTAHARDLRGIGIDAEPAEPLPGDMLNMICSLREQSVIAGAEQGVLARLIFSAKEAAYKAQYPLTREMLDFDHFEISLDHVAGRFAAVFQRPAGPFRAGDTLHGRFIRQGDHLVTLVTIGQGSADTV